MNVPAGSVIVSPSCAFVSWIACTFAAEPSDGQTVPKELDAAKKDNPAAIERNFLIFGLFLLAFFDFLLSAHLLANLLAEAPLPGAGGRLSLRQLSSGRFLSCSERFAKDGVTCQGKRRTKFSHSLRTTLSETVGRMRAVNRAGCATVTATAHMTL